MDNGFGLFGAGNGIHTIIGAGFVPTITADGGIRITGAGYGLPDIVGEVLGFRGVIQVHIGGGIHYHHVFITEEVLLFYPLKIIQKMMAGFS